MVLHFDTYLAIGMTKNTLNVISSVVLVSDMILDRFSCAIVVVVAVVLIFLICQNLVGHTKTENAMVFSALKYHPFLLDNLKD